VFYAIPGFRKLFYVWGKFVQLFHCRLKLFKRYNIKGGRKEPEMAFYRSQKSTSLFFKVKHLALQYNRLWCKAPSSSHLQIYKCLQQRLKCLQHRNGQIEWINVSLKAALHTNKFRPRSNIRICCWSHIVFRKWVTECKGDPDIFRIDQGLRNVDDTDWVILEAMVTS